MVPGCLSSSVPPQVPTTLVFVVLPSVVRKLFLPKGLEMSIVLTLGPPFLGVVVLNK